MWAALVVLLVVRESTADVKAKPLTIFSIGDWGGQTVDSPTAEAQLAVARAMGAVADELQPAFVLNVGDSFYKDGVNGTDDPLWKADFEDIYTAKGLQVPWYGILGNHDYGLDPEAQTKYRKDPRWVMPARYYARRVADHRLTLVFLDTNPCVEAYRSTDPSGWNPKTPRFQPNIVSQDCQAQVRWLRKELAAAPKDDFVWVVGHHPLFEIDATDLFPVFEEFQVDFYLCGHKHRLEHYRLDQSPLDHAINGAGCRVALPLSDDDDESTMRLRKNEHETVVEWKKKVAGFTVHTLSVDANTLTTDFINYKGKVIHQIVSRRR